MPCRASAPRSASAVSPSIGCASARKARVKPCGDRRVRYSPARSVAWRRTGRRASSFGSSSARASLKLGSGLLRKPHCIKPARMLHYDQQHHYEMVMVVDGGLPHHWLACGYWSRIHSLATTRLFSIPLQSAGPPDPPRRTGVRLRQRPSRATRAASGES
jgi:hypothetical protein